MRHIIDLREPSKAPTLDPLEFTLTDTDQAVARAIREGIVRAQINTEAENARDDSRKE